jgi:transposase InsO family protein
VIGSCEKLKQKDRRVDENWRGSKHVGLVQTDVAPVVEHGFVAPIRTVDKLFAPFCVNGSICNDKNEKRMIVFLRDSGSLQSLVSQECLMQNEWTDTNECRLLRGISGVVLERPLVKVRVECAFVQGEVLCCLMNDLPEGVSMVVGNDLAMDARVLDVAVTTRAQAKVYAAEVADCAQQMGSAELPHGVNDVDQGAMSVSAVSDDCVLNVDAGDLDRLYSNENAGTLNETQLFDCVSRNEFIKLQRECLELRPLFALAEVHGNVGVAGSPYEIVNDILIRHWADKITPYGMGVTQIVVPVQLRPKLLTVAHDMPLSGHLGTQKTLDRLLKHFWWPHVNKSVRAYCRSCDVCQRLGKGSKTYRAPMVNVPVMQEVFQRVAIDVVGPLSVCEKSGNRFILTVIDLASHFPFAFPLRNHTAKDVARCLSEVFTLFGFPKELLSDCGSEFMSDVMQVFLHECGVVQMKTSPFRPQSNGSCERFHRTMKDMLKALVESYPGSWDEILPWILFAYREVPVQGLGFSAFELMYGRDVRGLLQLMKEEWLHKDVVHEVSGRNVIEYVLQLRERMRVGMQIANDNAVVARDKSKKWYDKHTKEISFEEGEKVLLLLPLIGKPLQTRFCGPYVVLRRLGLVDYLVSTPDRRKSERVVHVNLMKRYTDRNEVALSVNLNESVAPLLMVDSVSSVNAVTLEDKVMECDVSVEQRHELREVLFAFEHVFSEVPGKTTMAVHRIELVEGAKPVKQAPYRLNPEKMAKVDKEIEELLRAGIIEESDSPWAAPIVVVPKPDGSDRLCSDFRKLNGVSVSDPFPMPRVEAMIDRVGKAKFMTKLDMTKGYWQIPVHKDSIPLTAFVTPHGHYQWKYMAFGLKNAPASFSRLITKVLKGLHEFCDAYLDDIIIFSVAWSDHLMHLKRVLKRIDEAHLTLNLRKCVFANAEIDFLGHHIGINGVQPRLKKVEALLRFPQPVNKKQVQSFLGLAGYYRRYLPHYSEIALPLTALTKKGIPFKWSSEAENAFIELKSRLASRPILIPPDFDKQFCVAVDASQFCVGACLFQVVDELERPICFLSRKLLPNEVRYSTIEKEALALMVALRAFSVYFGSATVLVFTDHKPLQFINQMANKNMKLLRWSLELQRFNIDIRHRPGKMNVVPDILSRPSV